MIRILPPRLANQIAAGEVVERPSSVVKELIENSLDAGATDIRVDIQRGGHKCIKITDNGSGVAKEQLELALSRHATSKIASLDDLEAIVSLGFRGEALASISSVARLTFTSKPAEQPQAWQAFAEGREMNVKLTPAAHPKGTTVEALDLFFNTPARRKFLRTEKTEFAHIDEVIRRIALSRFDVKFVLTHNGKQIRHYPSGLSEQQKVKRIAAICGNNFIQDALAITNEHEGISLSGWLGMGGALRRQNDLQYFYVNGRMMRDKVINHAIRQAYAGLIDDSLFPAFVLYLKMPADQVDVNVHPAKHEVRFHQTRLVHDFISQALISALSSSESKLEQQNLHAIREESHQYYPQPIQRSSRETAATYSHRGGEGNHQAAKLASQQHIGAVANFASAAKHTDTNSSTTISNQAAMAIIDGQFGLLIREGEALLVDLKAWDSKIYADYFASEVISQPLLMPISMTLEQHSLQTAIESQQLLEQLGFVYLINGQQLILRQVPAAIRNFDHAVLFSRLLAAPTEKRVPMLIDSIVEMKSYDQQQVAELLKLGGKFLQGDDICRPLKASVIAQLFGEADG